MKLECAYAIHCCITLSRIADKDLYINVVLLLMHFVRAHLEFFVFHVWFQNIYISKPITLTWQSVICVEAFIAFKS